MGLGRPIDVFSLRLAPARRHPFPPVPRPWVNRTGSYGRSRWGGAHSLVQLGWRSLDLECDCGSEDHVREIWPVLGSGNDASLR